MKRTILAGFAIILFAGIFFFTRPQQPKEGDVKVALCVANIYTKPSMDSSVWGSLKEGDEFTLTGRRTSASNGKGARYSLWEGTTADGTVGWVKANAFIETDYHGW